MMGFLEQVHAKRKKLADVLVDEEYSGIRGIVEELYPDKAHFIYELLQNAEDTGATDVTFSLHDDRLVFEHNGRPFSEADVEGITNIGKGSKRDDDETIGRFGVGFKAVFAYTETPRIWSPTYAFQIESLVLPSKLTAMPELGGITRFEFPFNNPKKQPLDAYIEVLSGLDELAETTLLFLSHIESIHWHVEGQSESEVLRIAHSEQHVEVLKQTGDNRTRSSHFLRFVHPVEGFEKQHIAIAFALDFLPDVSEFDPAKALNAQFAIVSAQPGYVAVFFPAEKETSGLRFHLHAPFVPELSRASIKETPTNQPLFQQLAELASRVLFTIRDLGLLTSNFLAVLPNQNDEIPMRYQCIREAIITEMNEQPLTPTQSKSYAPAMTLLQAKVSLKRLLSDKDLEILVDYEEEEPTWAIGVRQRNSAVDRFLSSLDISDWGFETFISVLEKQLSTRGHFDEVATEWINGSNPLFIDWLSEKTDEWHQMFYALLYRELEPAYALFRMNKLPVVRLENGEYDTGDECYFPTVETVENEHDAVLPRVARAVYNSGESKNEQESARKFLEGIGVREVGEAEQVEAILKERYSEKAELPDLMTYKHDLQRFISLVERVPKKADLFKDFLIFQRADNKWGRPDQLYLDAPYTDSGLSALYECLGENAGRAALSNNYLEYGVKVKNLARFAEKVGVSTRLDIEETKCSDNPDWDYLKSVPGIQYTSPLNSDFVITGLESLFKQPNLKLSQLLWKTLSELPKNSIYLLARFRKNMTNGTRQSDSQLVHQLRTIPWVPQGPDRFVRPSEATLELLPEGFPYDPGWEWIKKVHFGEDVTKQSEKKLKIREVARELGFDDDDSLDDAKWFAGLDQDERQQFKREHEDRMRTELPENAPGNPDRRAARVDEQAGDAPERITEKRTRSVSVGREAVKKDTVPYLRQQYTNDNDEMICQVCKAPLPFKLADGNYYFEAVEFLPELRKRHYQNYLAFCPNHVAMFKYANEDRELIKETFLDLGGNELEVNLAEKTATIYFTTTHIMDLKTIIASDDEQIDEQPLRAG